MDQRVISEAVGVAVAARVPVLLWGAPGTGKSSMVRAMADGLGVPCETVIATIREPADFGGLPVVHGGAVRLAPPMWATRLAEAGEGVLFLDEISTAPPAVQAALLRVVLERHVGELALPDGVTVVAAANPPQMAADGWDLAAALANRFCHLDWPATADDVVRGFTAGWPEVPKAKAPDAESITAWKSRIATYLLRRPGQALALPTEAAVAGRGWPSPRTWEMAAVLMAAADASGVDEQVRIALLGGVVGLGTAVELQEWLAEQDLVDPEALLADPGSADLPQRGDRLWAALSAVTAAVTAEPTVERWQAAWRILARVAASAPDVAAASARTLAANIPEGAEPPAEIEVFAAVLAEAGLL